MWSSSKVPPEAREAGEQPLRRIAQVRSLRSMGRTGAMTVAAAVLTAGALGLAASLAEDRVPAAQAFDTTQAGTAQPWVEIRRPIALFDLAGTEFARLQRAYRARRQGADGPREDIMTFGAPGDGRPFLEVSLLRTGRDAAVADWREPRRSTGDDLADDLARLAGTTRATLGQVRGIGAAATRLGNMDLATVQRWEQGHAAACLGFEGFPGGADGLRVAGFACGAPGRLIGRAALVCAIDRIDLVSAGDDRRLRAIFVAAERESPSTCDTGGSRSSAGLLTATGAQASWLDPTADLPFRGILEASNNRP